LNPTSAFWQTPWLNPLNDIVAWNALLQGVNKLWSVSEVRARVLGIEWECADVFSLLLKPNRLFKGFQAGQHVALELEINGVRKTRTFSISNAPNAKGLLRLTIKINPHGTVSKAASQLKKGDVVGLSQAAGAFTGNPVGGKALLISAGSGITPMMSLLQSWAALEDKPDVVLVHTCRREEQLIFAQQLQTLVHQWPELQVQLHFSTANGHLNAAQLAEQVPDLDSRDAFLCGPEAFKTWVQELYQQRGISQRLKQEHFRQLRFSALPDAERFTVHVGKDDVGFSAGNGQSLLDAAEQSGLKPVFGCRRGICMSCQCKKNSGIVRNQLTQLDSSDSEEWIQLCISTPLSDVHLEL
jgi:stearoyl-CoA 9-desaturase NADPH oxidoreductase